MILPRELNGARTGHDVTPASSSSHPTLSAMNIPPSLFTAMDPANSVVQSPEQLMAQYAAQMLRHHQQSKPYSRRTPAAKPYSCDQCGRGFKYLHTLRFHVKTTHDSAAPAAEPRLSRLRRDNCSSVPQNLSMGASGNTNASPDEKSMSDVESREEDTRGRDAESLEPESREPRDSAPVGVAEPAAKEPVFTGMLSLKKEPVEAPLDTPTFGQQGGGQDVQERQPCNITKMDLPVFAPGSVLNTATDVWRNMKIQSEVPLVSKVEAIYPPTEQQYTFYKCGICSEAFANVNALCDHLQSHTRAIKEHHCDKCGAVFKWRSQLMVHEQVHQVVEGKGLGHVLGSLPEALIGEPRVSFDQALQLGALAGQQLLPSFLQHGLPAMSLPLSLPGSTSVTPSTSLMELSTSASRGNNGGASKPACSSAPQDCGNASTSLRLPFQCSYCCKSFDRIFSLQRHERIHTGVKPCYCKACGRGFSERRNLRHHIIRFHSDVSQRDQLRRRRRAAAARSRNGNAGSPGGVAGGGGGSHKLVSFLKKTAVRILNSMDQTKEDSEDDDGVYDDDDAMVDDDDHDDGSDKDSDHLPLKEQEPLEENSLQHHREKDVQKTEEKVVEDDVEEDNRTIIYPLESTDTVPPPQEVPKTPFATDDRPPTIADDTKKVMTTANKRKKGKPVRYGAVAAAILGSPNRDLDMDGDQSGIKAEELRDDSAVEERSEAESADDGGNPYSEEEMAAWAQLGKQFVPGSTSENGDSCGTTILKAQSRGHGSFFSSYNPRLGVVENPISRDEACKPHVGPDGKIIYPCSYCTKTFCSTSDLNRHMDFHEGSSPFKLM
ncbi:uncharacterized protein LOC135386331 isoform X2 [Ornithodoros turicata]|uniref:uncharacterized protein LOC135386331 isoform X2 n=1 Tax=Ornithodoros turicata TaxID=34597 RepID=UPI003139F8B9